MGETLPAKTRQPGVNVPKLGPCDKVNHGFPLKLLRTRSSQLGASSLSSFQQHDNRILHFLDWWCDYGYCYDMCNGMFVQHLHELLITLYKGIQLPYLGYDLGLVLVLEMEMTESDVLRDRKACQQGPLLMIVSWKGRHKWVHPVVVTMGAVRVRVVG
ncbi:hypothetical protein BYT27DRAFT_7209279 [Phlegmacium glaucopus]|nr:hypothetical protein BYT27DRAFT_7209279 [Phlegmacium glaucopus]